MEVATAYILQIEFPYTSLWGEQMTAEMQQLAGSIAEEPGLLWEKLDRKSANQS